MKQCINKSIELIKKMHKKRNRNIIKDEII